MWCFVAAVLLAASAASENCRRQEPFTVTPDAPRWLAGVVLGMHGPDCAGVKEPRVQELIGLQWALSHWNHNPATAHRVALEARDSCSKAKDGLTEALHLLDESATCAGDLTPKSPRQLLGLVAGGGSDEAESFGRVLGGVSQLPLIAYTTPALTGLRAARPPLLIATAPSLEHYTAAAISVLSSMDSNFVAIVHSGDLIPSALAAVASQLEAAGVVVEFRRALDGADDDFWARLASAQTEVVICLLGKGELLELFTTQRRALPSKLWLTLPVGGEVLSPSEARILLGTPSGSSLVFLQERQVPLEDFRAYFLGTLGNNFHSFPLLATYMEQIHNCSLAAVPGFRPCSQISPGQMGLRYAQAPGVRSAVLAAYVLGALGSAVAEAPACLPSPDVPACAAVLRHTLRGLRYDFGPDDPAMFAGFSLQMEEGRDGVFTVRNLHVEAVQAAHDHRGQHLRKIMEFATGGEPRVFPNNFHWPQDKAIRSFCAENDASCRGCEGGSVTVDLSRVSLSLPRDYDLYVLAQFDFHTGPGCKTPFRREDRLTPAMAFLYSLWTFKDRFPRLRLLPGLNVGALVIDGCDDAAYALDLFLQSKSKCLVLQYPNRNITIAPSQVAGYSSLGKGETSDGLATLGPTLAKPLLSLRPSPAVFSLLPSAGSLIKATLGLLDAFQWNFVSVLHSDAALLAELRAEAPGSGVCIADVRRVDELAGNGTEPGAPVVLLLAGAEETLAVLRAAQDWVGKKTLVLVGAGAKSWSAHSSADPETLRLGLGLVSVAPAVKARADFLGWFRSITPARFPEPWFHRAVEEDFGCALTMAAKEREGSRACTGRELVSSRGPFGRLDLSSYVMEEMDTLLFAIDAAYRTFCPDLGGLCRRFYAQAPAKIAEILSETASMDEIEVHSFRLQSGGATPDYVKMGNWSERDSGLLVTRPWVDYDADGGESRRVPHSRCDPPLCRCTPTPDQLFGRPYHQTPRKRDYVEGVLHAGGSQVFVAERITVGIWKSPIWTYSMLGLTSLLQLGAVCVVLLVSIKLYYRVVKGNQSLGICLLLAVIGLFLAAVAFILPPSETVCGVRQGAHPVAFALAFSLMLAKALQLRNTETIGEGGGFIGVWNYWLLISFAVGLQVALSAQRALLRVAPAFVGGDCAYGRWEFVVEQGYPGLLLLLVAAAAVANRSIKRNYSETKWLLRSALLCAAVWALWLPLYVLLPDGTEAVVVVLSLLGCGSAVLGLMFGPKLYILLSYEAVLLEYPPGFKPSCPSARSVELSGPVSPGSDGALMSERAESPAAPSSASTRSTDAASSLSDASPVFQAVVRKKSRSRREKLSSRGSVLTPAHLRLPPLPPLHRP